MLTLTLLVSTLSLAFCVQRANASGTIYIGADGSIDPPTAPISTSDQSTYTFTDDVYDKMVVQRNNIVIDGNNHKVQGDGSGYGIDLRQRNNVTVKGVEVLRFESGICVHDASNIVLIGNKVSNSSRDGISGYRVSNSFFVNNVVSNNEYDGIYIGEVPSDSNMIIDNILSRNGASGIGLAGSKNCSLTNNTVYYNNLGIRLSYGADQNVVMNNTIFSNNYWGIGIDSSSNNSVICNTIKNNREAGLAFWYPSSYNKIHHNNFINNTNQVYVFGENSNVWDDGYPSGGNYWSDYTGVDANHDGISDTAYVIDANNIDHYPLMAPYVIPEFPSFPVLLLFMIATLLVIAAYRRKHLN
jgi:parallel beta-helix repeat protein